MSSFNTSAALPEEFQSGSAQLGAQLLRLSELSEEMARVSAVATSGKTSLENQMVELLKAKSEAVKRLEQNLEHLRAKAGGEVEAIREEMEAQVAKVQAASTSRENVLRQAHQTELTELGERLQKQLGDRKRSHDEELHQLEMVHDAEKSALSVKHATEMKKMSSEMQTAVEEHNTQLSALRAALESREGAAVQRSVAERERLELQHRDELAMLRQENESKLADLRAQLSLAAQASSEFTRKEATFGKEKESWLREKEAILDQQQREMSERDDRIYHLEQALSRYENELSERNELQRSLASLMSRANNLLGPNGAPAPVPPSQRSTPGRGKLGSMAFRAPSLCGSAGSTTSSPVCELDLDSQASARGIMNKENASPVAHV